jgi:hypothetical protein
MHRVPVHTTRVACPISRSDLTVDVWAVLNPDGTIAGVNAHARFGPGMGPHTTPSPDTMYAWGWQLVTAGGVMRRTLHLPTLARTPRDGLDLPAQIPGQLTITDALEADA